MVRSVSARLAALRWQLAAQEVCQNPRAGQQALWHDTMVWRAGLPTYLFLLRAAAEGGAGFGGPAAGRGGLLPRSGSGAQEEEVGVLQPSPPGSSQPQDLSEEELHRLSWRTRTLSRCTCLWVCLSNMSIARSNPLSGAPEN